jgi:hypothetical protein
MAALIRLKSWSVLLFGKKVKYIIKHSNFFSADLALTTVEVIKKK